MKALKTVLILSLVMLLSCEKDPECKTCNVKIESNSREALAKCGQRANSWPSVYETVHEYSQVFCEPFPKNTNRTELTCPGINTTIKTTYSCR